MRRFTQTGLVARMALESEDEADQSDAAIAGAETAETELLETADAEGELDGDQAANDEAVESKEALESLVDVMHDSLGNGGMSKGEARMMQLHVDHIVSRVGIADARRLPAMESYGVSSSRIGATKLAMEGVGEQIKKIWDAIVEAIKKAKQWIIDNFNKYFGAAEKLQKRAKAIKDRGSKLSGKAKEAKVKSSSLVKALHIAGKVDNVAAGIETVSVVVTKTFTRVTNHSLKETEKLIAGLEDDGKVATMSVTAAASNVGDDVYGAPGQDMVYQRGEEMPGGFAVVERAPSKAATGAEALELYSRQEVIVKPFNPKANAPTNEELPTLDGATIVKIATSVEKISDAIVGGRATEKKLTEALDKAVRAAEKHSKAVEGEEDAEKKKTARSLQKATGNLTKVLVGSVASVVGYAGRASSSALNYCELSLKQYA